MYKVLYNDQEVETLNLDEAMQVAKSVDCFVTITNGSFELVGRFGVDSIKDGKCPDGIEYDWNKASRIGAPKRVRA